MPLHLVAQRPAQIVIDISAVDAEREANCFAANSEDRTAGAARRIRIRRAQAPPL
jgi:hypothetical protein